MFHLMLKLISSSTSAKYTKFSQGYFCTISGICYDCDTRIIFQTYIAWEKMQANMPRRRWSELIFVKTIFWKNHKTFPRIWKCFVEWEGKCRDKKLPQRIINNQFLLINHSEFMEASFFLMLLLFVSVENWEILVALPSYTITPLSFPPTFTTRLLHLFMLLILKIFSSFYYYS